MGRHGGLPLPVREAVEIIRRLWAGGYVTHHGEHFDVGSAKLFDPPETPPEIGIAVSGPKSCAQAGRQADIMIATEPKSELIQMFGENGGGGKPVVGQAPVCWGSDEAATRKLAHEQFAWSLSGWKLQADLPNPENLQAYAGGDTEDQVAEKIPCGPDVEKIVQSVSQFIDAGFTEVALVQIGPDQAAFCDFFARELGPALRAL